MRDLHFHVIANGDTGDLVQFLRLFGSQFFNIQPFDLFFGYDTQFRPIYRIELVPLKNIEIWPSYDHIRVIYTPRERFRAPRLGA